MIISEIRDKGKSAKWISLEDGTCFALSRRDVLLYGLTENMDIPDEILEQIGAQLKKEAIQRSGVLLKERDYSEKGLRNKLIENGFTQDAAEYAVGALIEAGYLNDARMAENYIKYHLSDRSRARIRQDLAGRGISEENIEEGFRAAAVTEDGTDPETEQIKALLSKRHFSAENASWEEIQKEMAFLYRKGYPTEKIRKVLGGGTS